MCASLKYEELTPEELVCAIAARPLVYVPCGLLEWHGRHLPLGLDGLKIRALLLDCAARTGGVVTPVNWIGAPGFGSFSGTLTYESAFVRDLLVRMLEQVAKIGARFIALVTGHYGSAQVNTVKEAARLFMERASGVRVLARPEYEGVEVDGRTPADHAGKWETSLALHYFPELVRLDRHSPGEEPITRYDARYASWPAEREPWVWREDLREAATADLGARAARAISDRIVADVEAMCGA